MHCTTVYTEKLTCGTVYDRHYFYNAAFLPPVLTLSRIRRSSCFKIEVNEDLLVCNSNYSIKASSSYELHVINWTTSNSVSLLCNPNMNTLYNFTVTNTDCLYSDLPAPSFLYSKFSK